MKRSLRVRLLTILLGLTLMTVLLVGVSGYVNMRNTAEDLAKQLLEQTAQRIDHRIDDLVHTATAQGDVNRHLFETGWLRRDNFANLAGYWGEVLTVRKTISDVYLTHEEDGSTLVVTWLPERKGLTVQELRPTGRAGEMHLTNYRLDDYPRRVLDEPAYTAARAIGLLAAPSGGPLLASAALVRVAESATTRRDLDQRLWDWYQQAKQVGPRRSVWVDTYFFFDDTGETTYPGVTYASPLYKEDKLIGVVGIDFNAFSLCSYLKDIKVSAHGFAFVIEQKRDGSRQLIAHPDQGVLLREVQRAGGDRVNELVPLAELKDRLVVDFVSQIPAGVDPEKVEDAALRFRHAGRDYFGLYRGLEEKAGTAPRWLICLVLPEDDVLAHAKRNALYTLIIGLGVLMAAVVLSFWISGQVARPLEELARDVEKISRLEIDRSPGVRSSIYEVDRLVCSTEDMKTSLRSFRKYVPAELVARLMASGQEAVLGGERRRLTIYFSDIAAFTTISEAMEPERLVEHLGEYLQALSEQVLVSGGTVDKYIGDAIMAFWGAPVEMPGHALAACTAAIRNQQILVGMRERWAREGKPPFESRIGINTGEVVVGNIGSARRMNYTVIGDAVNLASRLEGLNKYYGTSVLITEATFEEAKAGVVARPLDWVSVKGKSAAVLVYELLGLKGEAPREMEELADLFGRGLMAYRRQEWAEALRLFDEVLARWPDDAPAREMKRRCESYREQPPGPGWDGVHHMTDK